MALSNFPRLPRGADGDRLVNLLNELLDELEFRINGHLDVKNIRAGGIEAKNIKAGAVTAEKIDVEKLSAISADLGTITAGLAQAIKIVASTIIGSYIATSEDAYPRSVMDNEGHFFGAYQDANNFIEMIASDAGTSAPTLRGASGGSFAFYQFVDELAYTLRVIARELNFETDVQGNINFRPAPGFNVGLPSLFSTLFESSGLTLQDYFDQKANAFSGFSGSFSTGTQTVTVSNGIITSVA